MRCLFCKQDLSSTKSIEHVIPESLGNKTMVLPRGYVCDKCNNYFAIKVEKPFMELSEIRQLRFQQRIPNKKNKMPQMEALYNGKSLVKLGWDVKKDDFIVYVDSNEEILKEIFQGEKGYFAFPAFTNETAIHNSIIVSRLLAKIALESLAYKLITIDKSLEELIDFKEYDLIRNHARRGNTPDWPCNIRRIYDMNFIIKRDENKWVQKIYESDFLVIDRGTRGEIKYVTIYFVLVLWGMEFAINMAEPEIDGYKQWVNQHCGMSPLYVRNNVENRYLEYMD